MRRAARIQKIPFALDRPSWWRSPLVSLDRAAPGEVAGEGIRVLKAALVYAPWRAEQRSATAARGLFPGVDFGGEPPLTNRGGLVDNSTCQLCRKARYLTFVTIGRVTIALRFPFRAADKK